MIIVSGEEKRYDLLRVSWKLSRTPVQILYNKHSNTPTGGTKEVQLHGDWQDSQPIRREKE